MDSFNLYRKVVDYDDYIRKYVVINIPSIHRDIRIHFLDELYNLLRLIYMAAYTKGNIRLKNITEIQVSIALLDFLTTKIRDMKVINKKYLDHSVDKLAEIKNMVYAWRHNEENSRS